MPMYSPFSEVGDVQREVHSLENKVDRKADDWKVNDLKSEVKSAYSKIQHLENEVCYLQGKLEGMEQQYREICDRVFALEQPRPTGEGGRV